MATRASRIQRRNSLASLDSQGVPIFGTVIQTTRTPAATPQKEARREEARRKQYPTLAEHVAYLEKIGHDPIMIPGNPRRRQLLHEWIENVRPSTPQEYHQLEGWKKELNDVWS